jgi:hypothetical protein
LFLTVLKAEWFKIKVYRNLVLVEGWLSYHVFTWRKTKRDTQRVRDRKRESKTVRKYETHTHREREREREREKALSLFLQRL